MGRGLVVVIQARCGSSRFPRKVLAEVLGRPMLRFQLDRLESLRCDELVIATSDLPADDAIVTLAADAGVAVVRGPETDVLARFGAVMTRFDPETVVRLTGDCPLADPGIVGEVIELHLSSDVDYTSNVHPRSFPKGLDVEVMRSRSLAIALEDAVDPFDREHVTPYLYRNPERFTAANLDSGLGLEDLWWTVDTREDLDRVREIVDLLEDPVGAAWVDILAAARAAGLAT